MSVHVANGIFLLLRSLLFLTVFVVFAAVTKETRRFLIEKLFSRSQTLFYGFYLRNTYVERVRVRVRVCVVCTSVEYIAENSVNEYLRTSITFENYELYFEKFRLALEFAFFTISTLTRTPHPAPRAPRHVCCSFFSSVSLSRARKNPLTLTEQPLSLYCWYFYFVYSRIREIKRFHFFGK